MDRVHEQGPSDGLASMDTAHPPSHQWAMSTLTHMLVLPEAWVGWSVVHENPLQAFIFCTLSCAVGMLLTTSALAVAIAGFGWVFRIPCFIYGACHLGAFHNIWRHGPMISKTIPHYACGVVGAVALIATLLPVNATPVEDVPFGHNLLFMTILTVGIWASLFSISLGLWEVDLPSKPHRFEPSSTVEM